MRKGSPFLLTFLLGVTDLGAQDFASAYREESIPFEVYERKASSRIRTIDSQGETPLRRAKYFGSSELPKATGWKSSELQKRFERVRDEKVHFRGASQELKRRLSWLYPDDGCYARAAMANRNIFRWFYPIPKKVFAFGNLKVETKNSPKGYVTWWYHVAPIVEVSGEKFVLDPSIEAERPLQLVEWLDRMGTPEKIKVAICESGTYSPSSNCDTRTDGMELTAERVQKVFLTREERRLERLGREAERELGEEPPWGQEQD